MEENLNNALSPYSSGCLLILEQQCSGERKLKVIALFVGLSSYMANKWTEGDNAYYGYRPIRRAVFLYHDVFIIFY